MGEIELIGIVGFGYTGSSAVFDYLKKYKELTFLNSEFPLIYRPDGLQSLEFDLNINVNRFFSADYAITRFKFLVIAYLKEIKVNKNTQKKVIRILNQYINDISDIEWNTPIVKHKASNVYGGFKAPFHIYFLQRLNNLLNKLNIYSFDLRKHENRYFSVRPKDFLKHSTKFLENVLTILTDTEYHDNFVLDQPFSADNINQGLHYFKNPKVIVVDRDPRDLYVYAREKKGGINFIPSDNVHDFVTYYNKIRETYILNGPYDNNKVLFIQYEDMIYNFSKTAQVIDEFLGLKHNHSLETFNPEISKKYTKLFINDKHKKDIDYIEKKLEDWLYTF